ncbi:hypothetical protein AGMMS50239_27110 [Bacteroidia bacterium]|nr:hypothetical protein AGMMS50239_27110 [Bacteroidia bacterium]
MADLLASLVPDWEITKAEDSQTALQLIKTHTYDLLFADIEMPQMDGLDLLQEIKRTGKKPHIILVSAYDKFEYAQKGMESGASGYILKPIEKDRVLQALQRYFNEVNSHKTAPETIVFNKCNGSFPIRTTDILAIEKQEKYIFKVYKKEDCVCNCRGTLNEVFLQLPENFIHINRQCIVNAHFIERFNSLSKEIILLQNNRELRFVASRDKWKNIKQILSSV